MSIKSTRFKFHFRTERKKLSADYWDIQLSLSQGWVELKLSFQVSVSSNVNKENWSIKTDEKYGLKVGSCDIEPKPKIGWTEFFKIWKKEIIKNPCFVR